MIFYAVSPFAKGPGTRLVYNLVLAGIRSGVRVNCIFIFAVTKYGTRENCLYTSEILPAALSPVSAVSIYCHSRNGMRGCVRI